MTEHLMAILQNGQMIGCIGYNEDKKIITEGMIGENTYDNFIELIRGLQGFDITIDNFYF